jgi:hypothetical protein
MKSAVTGLFFTVFQNFDASLTAWPTVNPVIATANVPQWVTLTWSPPTTGTWKYDNGIGAELCIIVGNSANMNIVGTVGNTLEITGLVVLPGVRAYTAALSPLLMRPYDQELLLCKRYYQPITVGAHSYAPASTNVGASVSYPVQMRISPTVSANSNAGFNVGTTTVDQITATDFRFYAVTSTANAYNVYYAGRLDARL